MYANDFDENGTNDIVLSHTKEEKEVPLRGRECSSQQIPAIAKRYKTYREFAGADLQEIYGSKMLDNSLHYNAKTFAHTWFENTGNTFEKRHELPLESQFSNVNTMIEIDYNQDDYKDLLITGNMYHTEVETPRLDSGLGMVLVGSAKGFQTISNNKTGLLFRDDVKNMLSIKLANGKTGYLLATNNSYLRLLECNK